MVLQGVSVCPGYVRANSFLLSQLPQFDLNARSQLSPAETQEVANRAIAVIAQQLETRRQAYEAAGDAEMADLHQVQATMLEDPTFLDEIHSAIEGGAEAAAAVLTSGSMLEQMLLSLNDEYMSARAEDIRDLSTRIACQIQGVAYPSLSDLPQPCIVVASQLLPSMLMSADLKQVKGIVIGLGTKTSHVSILASGLQIPTVVGCGDVSAIADDQVLYLDGEKGTIHFNLTAKQTAACDRDLAAYEIRRAQLEEYATKPLRSADGVDAKLLVNITEPRELENTGLDAFDGVGLFRSEFLFLDRQTLPSEEDQYQAYATAARQLQGKVLTIRTIDIGGDKECACLNLPKEENPFMGFRAVRICMERHDLILTQLRAILRAATQGQIQIMFPMIATVGELKAMLDLLEQARSQLAAQNVPYGEHIKIGIMVEVPSAVVMLDQLLPLIDFVSIGSNDLVQYTYAADRLNEKVSYLNQFLHPAALRLIAHTVTLAQSYGKECSLCGEMAGDKLGFAALALLGLRKFSVSPSKLLQNKAAFAKLDLAALAPVGQQLLSCTSAEETVSLLKQTLPEDYFG